MKKRKDRKSDLILEAVLVRERSTFFSPPPPPSPPHSLLSFSFSSSLSSLSSLPLALCGHPASIPRMQMILGQVWGYPPLPPSLHPSPRPLPPSLPPPPPGGAGRWVGGRPGAPENHTVSLGKPRPGQSGLGTVLSAFHYSSG